MAKKKSKKKANGKVGGKADVHINEDGGKNKRSPYAVFNTWTASNHNNAWKRNGSFSFEAGKTDATN